MKDGIKVIDYILHGQNENVFAMRAAFDEDVIFNLH